MTRFARVRSSVSNSVRQPEAATPWAILKANVVIESKKSDVESLDDVYHHEDSNNDVHLNTNDGNEMLSESNSIPLSHGQEEISEQTSESKLESSLSLSLSSSKKTRRRGQNKCLECKEPGHLKRECPTLSEERRTELQELVKMKVERKGEGVGRKRKKKKNNNENKEEDGEKQGLKNDVSNETSHGESGLTKSQDKKKKKKKKKTAKVDKSGHVVGPNEALFQGFRVQVSDAERLNDLRIELSRQKNLSQEEREATLKMERRRAEKALQRVIKQVCYLCRKPGHILDNCPESKNKSKTCFKCGSETHMSHECTQKRFAFAKCFVCGELGHLARECDANPRGLYPKGGGCRMCGSVEHLKSECPKKRRMDAREETTANVINQCKDLEVIDDIQSGIKEEGMQSKKRRVVHF